MEDVEESKGNKQPDAHNQMIRECGNFLSDREESTAFNFNVQHKMAESYSSEEADSKNMIGEKQSDPPDEDYEYITCFDQIKGLLPEDYVLDKTCNLCNKADDPVVGPFCKFEDAGKTKLVGKPLHFHQDCIEFNNYSSFRSTDKKWVNIGKALDNLVHKDSHNCYRCGTKGASVQCFTCAKPFHGFKCAKQYTIRLDSDAEQGPPTYQCLFCINTKNFEDRESQIVSGEQPQAGGLRDADYLQQLRDIPKQ